MTLWLQVESTNHTTVLPICSIKNKWGHKFCNNFFSLFWSIFQLFYNMNYILVNIDCHYPVSEWSFNLNESHLHWFVICNHAVLKTLFNSVEDRSIFKIVELWCLCCIMMFRWINKQQGMQEFWHLFSQYEEIYDWISSFNIQSVLPFILTQQSMGGNEYGQSGHLSIFTLLKHLIMFLKYKFFEGFIFTPYQRHW